MGHLGLLSVYVRCYFLCKIVCSILNNRSDQLEWANLIPVDEKYIFCCISFDTKYVRVQFKIVVKGPVIIYVGGWGDFFCFSMKEKIRPSPLNPLVNS